MAILFHDQHVELQSFTCHCCHYLQLKISLLLIIKGKGSPYLIAEYSVPELIPVLGSKSAGDVSHKPGGRLPLLSTRPTVTLATLKRAAISLLGEQRHNGCEQFA